MTFLHIDFESASAIDLTKVGASRYSRDPSTVVLAVAWSFDNGPVYSVTLPKMLPPDVFSHVAGGLPFAAWNANFETNILENQFGVKVRADQAICTMQRALYAGLPAKLEKAGPALGLSQVKDMVGHRLMMKMSKPTKHGWFWHQDPVDGPAMLAELALYCEGDVLAEREVSRFIPYLPVEETEVSALDFHANRKGIKIDLGLVKKLIKIAADETDLLNLHCAQMTSGEVTSPGTQTDRLTKWLRNEGVVIKSLGKDDVAETLETPDLPGLTREVLKLRQKVAKSSTKKLQAMLKMVDTDQRVRGTLQYYGASRTGRFSGRMIQPQNFPRPEKYANDAIKLVLDYDIDADALRVFYGDPLTVVASCLRGCLIPTAGKVFYVYDLAQIEARVLAWLAAQKDVVKAFADYDAGTGPDVYTYTANKTGFTGNRPAGKVMTLGLGYGMGHVAFVDFAKTYGLKLTEQQSADIVYNWREANTEIRKFWWGLDAAAKTAIRCPGVEVTVGRIKLKVRDSFGKPVLLIKLPSGRILFYRNPRLDTDPVQPQHESITFDGIDQWTKLWQPIRTWGSKLAENVTQAVARDVIVHGALEVSILPGIDLVLSVHDELLFEGPDDRVYWQEVRELVETVPPWAKGLPIKADGDIMERYGK